MAICLFCESFLPFYYATIGITYFVANFGVLKLIRSKGIIVKHLLEDCFSLFTA